MPWVPFTLLEVSCKGKTLLACAGTSPDVEVFDVFSMRRLVRLFGHGEWCVDICRRNKEEGIPGGQSSHDMEPTIYSVDRGGAICCWLPDRTCGKGVVGWIPSVQVHCVPVAFPTCLALDAMSRNLVVLGIGECVTYALGSDHRFADRQAKPSVLSFGGKGPRGFLREVNGPGDAEEPPEKTRRRRHASVAAARPPLRRWNSAPPDADGTEMEAARGTPRASTGSNEKACEALTLIDRMALETGGRGLGDMQRWTRMRAVVMSGDNRALIWEQGNGICLLDVAEGTETEVLGKNVSCVAGDSDGWILAVTDDGAVHVWSPCPITAPYKEPVHSMSAHAALRERHRKQGKEEDGSQGYVRQVPSQQDGGGAHARAKGPESFAALSEVWSFAGGGRVELGRVGMGKEAQRSDCDDCCTLLHVSGARPPKDFGDDARNGGLQWESLRASWVVASRAGCVRIHDLPEGKICCKLEGRGCPVSAMLWPENSDNIITGALDGIVQVWNTRESRLLHTYCEHSAAVTALSHMHPAACSYLRASNVFCSCGADRNVLIATYEESEAGGFRVLTVLQGHSTPVCSLHWATRHSHLYTCCSDGSLYVWQLQQHEQSQLIRVVQPGDASLVLLALDRKTTHLGGALMAESGAIRDDVDTESKEGGHQRVLHDEDDQDSCESLAPIEAADCPPGSACPDVLLVRSDVISMASGRGKDAGNVLSRLTRSVSPEGGDIAPISLQASPLSRTPNQSGSGKESLEQGPGQRGFPASLVLGLAALMSQLVCPLGSPEKAKNAVAAALADLGIPSFLSPEHTGTFDSDGAFSPPPFVTSSALVGAGDAVTCLMPSVSSSSGSLSVSRGFTTAITLSAAVLLESSRALCSSTSRAAEASGELVQYVVKGLASKAINYKECDVISLAKYWLLAPDSARQAAHTLLTATLGRTDAAKRKEIVAEWTPRLGGGLGSSHGSKDILKASFPSHKEYVLPQQQQGEAVGVGSDGFKGREGPALVVLAVIGSHFKEALDKQTCAQVADALVRAVSSGNALHAKVASHLLSRGAAVWGPHIKDGEGLLRTLYARYWRFNDFNTTMADSEWALRSLAPVLPAQFVEVVGEEASKHSQLVCHVRSERTVTAIKVLVALIKKNPIEMLPALPRAVEIVLRTLDPGHPNVRQALMQHSTAALKEFVRKFPMAAFHQDTQRFAVGTVDALVVIYDLRTATKWRVLEGHEGAIRHVICSVVHFIIVFVPVSPNCLVWVSFGTCVFQKGSER